MYQILSHQYITHILTKSFEQAGAELGQAQIQLELGLTLIKI